MPTPRDRDLTALARAEAARRELARRSFAHFVGYTWPGYRWNWHHRVICDALERVYRAALGHPDGLRRLMIFAPPRHGKSELVSRRFPAWVLGLQPSWHVIAVSYSSLLIESMSAAVADTMLGERYAHLFPGVRPHGHRGRVKRSDWGLVGHRGGYRCAGVGGSVTGHGARLILIDDPVKNQEEADSDTLRDKLDEFYLSTLYTRRDRSDTPIVLMQTRWHDDELAQRLIRRADQGGEQWTVLELPAINETGPTATDPRREGEALWPDLFSRDDLAQIRANVMPRVWTALYQQQPTPEGGAIFRAEWFRHYERRGNLVRLGPTGRWVDLSTCEHYASCDLSYKTRDTNDWTVICVWAVVEAHGVKNAVLVAFDRARRPAPETTRLLLEWQERYRWSHVSLEDNGPQAASVQFCQEAGVRVLAEKADTDKVARARQASPYLYAGRVWWPQVSEWRATLEQELTRFPAAKHDDVVDAVVYGVIQLGRLSRLQIVPPSVARAPDAPWRTRVKGGW